MDTRWKQSRVGVLMGGLSVEREVSLDTGRGVHAALVERGYDVVAIDWHDGQSLPKLLADAGVAVVWNALHGTYGEDGGVQGLCQCMHIACTGSGVLASALAMDKVMSKRIFDSSGVPTPAWALVDPHAVALPDGFAPPLVIKPACEGSSVGVTIVHAAAEIPDALALARRYHGPTLVEAFIAGDEIQTAIFEGDVLGSVEIVPAVEFYDYDAKYKRDDTQYLLPPHLAPEPLAAVEAAALHAHNALACSTYSRVDLRLSTDGTPFVLEVNTLPGMTSHSLLPKIGAHRGIDYATLCERILAGTILSF